MTTAANRNAIGQRRTSTRSEPQRSARRRRRLLARALTLAASSIALSTCTSVQWLDRTGTPHSLGLAWRTPSSSDAGITRIVAPGAALRLIPGLAGYSLGWRETVLFQTTNPQQPRELVAFVDRLYGLALDTTQIVVGSSHTVAVFEPKTDVIQGIWYSDSDPSASRIVRQEVK